MGRYSAETQFNPDDIPQLAPDTEPVEEVDRFAPTNPGMLGFKAPEIKRRAAERSEPRPVTYESRQRRAILEEFMHMDAEAEARREAASQPPVPTVLGGQAVQGVVRPPVRAIEGPHVPPRTFYPQQ